MATYNDNWRLNYTTRMMDLLHTKERGGLTTEQHEELKKLWSGLTDYGREYFEIWCEDNNINIPA